MNKNREDIDYTTHPYLRQRWDRVGRALALQAGGAEELGRWRRKLTKKLKELIGYGTMRACPLKPRVLEERDCGDYVRQHVEIQTEPGVRMPLYVLIPKSGRPPYPAVIAPHGHVSGGKVSPAGVVDRPEIARTVKQYNYDYGVQFARAGMIAFCPDARGFGERQEAPIRATGDILRSSCQLLNNMAYPLGQTVTGMWTWDLHRLIDYIETRADCREGRIGCGGLSGGGLQTLWAAALDSRIRCAVISGYLYGFKESLLDVPCCSCNYVPGLYEQADMGDIAALIAPRPLLVETGMRDDLNGRSGMKNVLPQVAIIRRAYRVLGVPERFKHDVFDKGHEWRGVEAVPWMKRWLNAPESDLNQRSGSQV